MRRAEHAIEHGDRPMSSAELRPYLDDLERLNRLARGYRVTLRALWRLVGSAARARIVDVGGSRGDLAMQIARDARPRGRTVAIVVVDRDEASLVMGVRAAKSHPEIHFVQAEATALPFRPGSFDAAVTSLTIHHLEPDEAVSALAAMRVVARAGVVVNDLIRDRVTLAGCWLATRLFARHPFARHDGPLSVRRAYTARELEPLAARAGFGQFRIRHHHLLGRLIGVGS